MIPERIVQAGGGADALVWIILAIFWVVAQVISKAARRLPPSKPQSPPRPQPRGAVPSELQDFLNSLAQLQSGPIEPPPLDTPLRPIPYGQTVAPPPPPQPHQPQPQTRRKHKQKAPKHVDPVIEEVLPPTPAAPQSLAEVSFDSRVEALPRAVTAQRTDTARQFLAATEKAFRMKMPTMTPGGQHRKPSPLLQKMLTGKAALRQAMLSRIVLGPPKAFS